MLTLESLKTEVDHLRETCRMTDSNTMETRQLLTAQTSRVLAEQGIGFGSLAIAMNQTQQEVHSLRTDVHGLKADVTGLQLTVYELKSDVKDLKADVKDLKADVKIIHERLGGLETRVERLEVRMDRMDRNLVAIMQHLGVEPVAA